MHQRYHALDALRATMMLLGIVLHAALNYITVPDPIYFYSDPSTSVSMDLTVILIHLFRMPTFFVMAGFFTALLCLRRGQQAMLANRLQRIALPFALFWPPLYLISALIFLLAIHWIEYGHWGIDQNLALKYQPNAEREYGFNTLHLWFLYYLLLFYLLLIPLRGLMQRLPSLAVGLERVFGFLLRSPFGPLLLTLPIAAVGYDYPAGMVAINGSFIPEFSQLIYHGSFFVAGWFLYKHRHCLEHYRAHWGRYGAAFLLSVVLLLVLLDSHLRGVGGSVPLYLCLCITINLSSWLGVFMLVGGFQRYLDQPSEKLRYLTDASYWVYLIHILFTMTIAVLLRDLSWPAELKFLSVCLITSLICFGSYHFGVRRTAIGRLLNGRRYI